MNTKTAPEFFEELQKMFGTHEPMYNFVQPSFTEKYNVATINIGGNKRFEVAVGINALKDTVTIFSQFPAMDGSVEQAPESLKIIWRTNEDIRIVETLRKSTYHIDMFCRKINEKIFQTVHDKENTTNIPEGFYFLEKAFS